MVEFEDLADGDDDDGPMKFVSLDKSEVEKFLL